MYRILIVEDDEIIAGVMESPLKGWGYEVLRSTDFQHVMGDFVQFGPQLVLWELNLPSYNGYHWCAQIRQVSKGPVIFISSASDNEYCNGDEYGRG